MTSLRTTLATACCALYIDLAHALHDAFDPLTETLLPHLLKLSGSTKKLVAEASQGVTAAIIDAGACPARVWVPFLEQGCAERTVQSRQWAMAHVGRYLSTQARRQGGRQVLEGTTLLNSAQGTALAALAELVKKGLTNPNPGVKEEARGAFVVLHREWPRVGEKMLGGLEEGVRRQVDKALAAAASNTVDIPAITGPASTEQQPETTTKTTAPAAPAPAPAPVRRTAAGKPSSAIAAAIKKAKEEQRAARLAEAEAEARAKEADAEQGPGVERQPEHAGEDEVNGTSKNGAAQEDAKPPNAEESTGRSPARSSTTVPVASPSPQTPVKRETLVKHETPVKHKTPAKQETPSQTETPVKHETPVKPVSLLDFQTPNGTSDAFKVMTPAPVKTSQLELLEATGISLPEPVDAAPSSSPPRMIAAESGADATPAQSNTLPEAPRPRRPRVSINPVAGMDKPKALYAKLRTLVDCSFWLDRRQGESWRACHGYVADSLLADYDQECDDDLSELLTRSSSPVTLADISGFIAWSRRHAQTQLQDELNDDAIREHVHTALDDAELAEGTRDAHVARLIDLVQETLVTHQVSYPCAVRTRADTA